MAYTMENQLLDVAGDLGWSFEEAVNERLSEMIGPSVPERFRRLVREVLLRLPGSWDYSYATWRVEADGERIPPTHFPPLGWKEVRDICYPEYVIKITPSEMAGWSDEACSWTLAQSFAYIAFKLLLRLSEDGGAGESLFSRSDEQAHAEITRTIALWWGFESELKAYEKEVCSQKKDIRRMIQ